MYTFGGDRLGGPRNENRSARSFTLIELLVVVAVTALLIAILIPSLRGARDSTKSVVCITNVRSIALGSLSYAASDSAEQAIPIHPFAGTLGEDMGAYSYGGKSGRGERVVANDYGSSVWGTAMGRGPATRPLNSVLFKANLLNYADDPGPNQANWVADAHLELPVFKCPADRGYRGAHFPAWRASGLASFDHYGSSYAASIVWGEWPSYAAASCDVLCFTPGYHALSSIRNTADTVYYSENAGRFYWAINILRPGGEMYHCFEGPGNVLYDARTSVRVSDPEKAVRSWHSKPYQVNCAFVDGHAGSVTMKGRQIPPPQLSVYPQIMFGNHEEDAWTYYCVVIRGSGWQLDTLPTPPARTGTQCTPH